MSRTMTRQSRQSTSRRISSAAAAVGIGALGAFVALQGYGPERQRAFSVPVAALGDHEATSALPSDSIVGAVRAWRGVGHVADYQGFTQSANTVTLDFESHDTGVRFGLVITREGASSRVVDVKGRLPVGSRPFDRMTEAPLNAQATNEVENVRLVPREDTEPGIAVEWSNFYKSPVPGLGGDLCTVRLRALTGEVVAEKTVAVDAPLNEAARDAVSLLEMNLPAGPVQPEPSVRCQEWQGPGFTLAGPARFTQDPPGAAGEHSRRPDTAWIVQKLEWRGSEFASVWECQGRGMNGEGEVIASGASRVYRHPADGTPSQVEAAIDVDVTGDPRDVSSTRVTCRLINSEL